MIDISPLLEFDRLAREDGKKYRKKRYIFSEIAKTKGKHFIAIAGPRGSGKTTLLKQIALEKRNSFYVSLDTIKNGDIFEIVKKLHTDLNINLFLLDEVHFHPAFDEGLKKIYDFLSVKVVFTSSVSLALFESGFDLSRRVLLKKLYPFSFREYLFFKYNKNLPLLSLSDIIEKRWTRSVFEYAENFIDYLQGGVLPFSLDEALPFPILKNIVTTVIRKDIPSLGKVTIDELEIIEQMLAFIGKSQIDGINYSSLSKNLGITKYKAQQYVNFLEKAFVLHKIMPKGTNILKEPKILMALPYRLLYSNYEDAVGGLREDFFVEIMRSLDIDFYYLKSNRGAKTPDYLLSLKNTDIVIEIGGKNKGREQFKGIQTKKKIILTSSVETSGIKRPLFLLGLLK
ncbi:MAG: ATP-binding protein [Candidatus Omnitrophica bacterium]|nr:ATP-binding protein [Candidatus Omnitrophota bacterium]